MPGQPIYPRVKRGMDVALCTVALAVLAPALALIVIAIKLDSPGPAIFRQQRLGLGGRPFIMYKFRSMRVGAEAGGVYEAHRDERVTRLGPLLRRTSIDELPQLVNIIRGDMSIIGPRPTLDYRRMQTLLAKLGETHTVIVDAPPLLPVTDAALLTVASDGAILVVQQGKTRIEQLELAARKLTQVEGTLLGVVLNMVPKKDLGEATFGYGYGSYTSSYYSKSDEDGGTRRRHGETPKRAKRTQQPAVTTAAEDLPLAAQRTS